MDSSVSPKDEIWFLRVCHHISTGLYLILIPCHSVNPVSASSVHSARNSFCLSLVQFTLLKPTYLTLLWSVLCRVFHFPGNAIGKCCFAVQICSFRRCIQIVSRTLYRIICPLFHHGIVRVVDTAIWCCMIWTKDCHSKSCRQWTLRTVT